MSVNTPSFISSLKKYRDGFRGYVVVNYILLVITPFLVIMSLFLIYYMRTSLNSYCENTLKLIESEQERLNEISSTLIEESMFPYYGNYLDDLNIPGEYGERIDALVQESMDRELSLRTDVDEIIMSYGGRTITAGQNFRNVYETLNSYDEVLEKSGGRPLWITALEAFLVSMYHGVNQKIHIPIDKLKNNVDEFAQGNMLVQGFDTNPIW